MSLTCRTLLSILSRSLPRVPRPPHEGAPRVTLTLGMQAPSIPFPEGLKTHPCMLASVAEPGSPHSLVPAFTASVLGEGVRVRVGHTELGMRGAAHVRQHLFRVSRFVCEVQNSLGKALRTSPDQRVLTLSNSPLCLQGCSPWKLMGSLPHPLSLLCSESTALGALGFQSRLWFLSHQPAASLE